MYKSIYTQTVIYKIQILIYGIEVKTVHDLTHVESKKAKLIETKSRLVVARDSRVWEMGKCWSNGTNFQGREE